MVKSEVVRQELLEICRENRGVLRPEDVVEQARSPKSVLHGLFQWDDSEAAREYRLWQARELIRVSVVMLPEAGGEPTRAFVSLMDDRTKEAGGYRCLVVTPSRYASAPAMSVPLPLGLKYNASLITRRTC